MGSINRLIKIGVAIAAIATVAAFTYSSKDKIVKAEHKTVFHMVEGLTTYRAMPTSTCPMDRMNPFIFLNHHGPQKFPQNNNGLPFGPHPHRGFETVTFILDGDLKHRDNTGFESIIKSGGVQWMTAGSGIIHAEESSEEFLKNGGNVEILQLWLNLPQELKWTAPNYHGIPADEVTHISSEDGKTTINLISGNWKGQQGPHASLTNVFMSFVEFKKGGKFNPIIPKGREIFFYVVSGKVNIGEKSIDKLTLVEFSDDGEQINVVAPEESVILFGHADPIDEPIFSKGPFVMNSKEEVKQAWKDYYDGKFGPFLAD